MKKLILIIFLFPSVIYGQQLTLPVNASGSIMFDSTLKVKGASTPELYQRAKAFIKHEFASGKILKDERSSGAYEMNVQATMPSVVVSMLTPDSYTSFVLALQMDAGKYHYHISDFIFNMKTVTDSLFTQAFEVKEVKIMSRKKWQEAHRLLASQIKSMTDRLHDYMTGKKP